MNFDIENFIPLFIIVMIISFGIFIFYESKKDFEFWKKEHDYIIYNDCYNYHGKYYCIKEV